MLKFFLDLIIKEELVDDRSQYVHHNKKSKKSKRTAYDNMWFENGYNILLKRGG